mmetsp:Transcript_29578/g.83434  ORF Transcript_29578/g.83434 Transcript_29578/m.83434 type:complete len:213 (-) Transcript_29578:145-783(-)
MACTASLCVVCQVGTMRGAGCFREEQVTVLQGLRGKPKPGHPLGPEVLVKLQRTNHLWAASKQSCGGGARAGMMQYSCAARHDKAVGESLEATQHDAAAASPAICHGAHGSPAGVFQGLPAPRENDGIPLDGSESRQENGSKMRCVAKEPHRAHSSKVYQHGTAGWICGRIARVRAAHGGLQQGQLAFGERGEGHDAVTGLPGEEANSLDVR